MASTYDGLFKTRRRRSADGCRRGSGSARRPTPATSGCDRRSDHQAADAAADHALDTPPSAAPAPARPWRKWLLRAGIVVSLAAGGYFLIPYVETVLNTVSTDDAYVNGHVTLVAPRVAGLVSRVLVDDNYRVRKGDLLVQLDKEPYQVQVDVKKAAVINGEADLEVARSQVRGTLALARSQRWKLQRAMEDVDDTVAQLRARVAALRSKEATLERARADFARAKGVFSRNALSREDFDQRVEAERTAAAGAKQALEDVYEARVALGLAARPETGDLAEVPVDLNQTFSGVREALAELVQSLALSVSHSPLRPRRPGKPSRNSPAATRRGTSTGSWSGSCRRHRRSGRPRPGSSRPGATSPGRSWTSAIATSPARSMAW